jgi:hypothetical protein
MAHVEPDKLAGSLKHALLNQNNSLHHVGSRIGISFFFRLRCSNIMKNVFALSYPSLRHEVGGPIFSHFYGLPITNK